MKPCRENSRAVERSPCQRRLFRLEHVRLELAAIPRRILARDHECAVAAIMDGAWEFRRRRSVGLHDFQDEQAVFVDQAGIDQPAFKIGVAFLDQRRIDDGAGFCGQAELLKLVDVPSAGVSDADHRFRDVGGRDVDHALLAFTHHVEALIFAPDIAADQRRAKTHDHVPAHGHDVGAQLPSRADENDRTRFEKAAHIVDGEIGLRVGLHREAFELCDGVRPDHSGWADPWPLAESWMLFEAVPPCKRLHCSRAQDWRETLYIIRFSETLSA